MSIIYFYPIRSIFSILNLIFCYNSTLEFLLWNMFPARQSSIYILIAFILMYMSHDESEGNSWKPKPWLCRRHAAWSNMFQYVQSVSVLQILCLLEDHWLSCAYLLFYTYEEIPLDEFSIWRICQLAIEFARGGFQNLWSKKKNSAKKLTQSDGWYILAVSCTSIKINIYGC